MRNVFAIAWGDDGLYNFLEGQCCMLLVLVELVPFHSNSYLFATQKFED